MKGQVGEVITRIIGVLIGVTFDNEDVRQNRQGIINEMVEQWLLRHGCKLVLRRETNNPHDRNAIAVVGPGFRKLGYITRELAAELAPVLDSGENDYAVSVYEVICRIRWILLWSRDKNIASKEYSYDSFQ